MVAPRPNSIVDSIVDRIRNEKSGPVPAPPSQETRNSNRQVLSNPVGTGSGLTQFSCLSSATIPDDLTMSCSSMADLMASQAESSQAGEKESLLLRLQQIQQEEDSQLVQTKQSLSR